MMSLWKKLLAAVGPPAPMTVQPAPPAPATAPLAPSPAQKRDAAGHAARFARAIEACRIAIEHGESTVERLAEHERWRNYYAGLAALEAARPDAALTDAAAVEGDD